MRILRSRTSDGEDMEVLEAKDLEAWSQAVVGRLTFRFGLAVATAIVTAAVLWTKQVTRVEAMEVKLNTMDLSGTQHERNLEDRLKRIEWLLEGLPDSIAVRVKVEKRK